MLKQFKREALLTKIMGILYNDSNDPSIIRIATDGLIIILEQAGYIFPRATFEEILDKHLNLQLPKNLPADSSGKYVVANAIVNLADQINITVEELIRLRIKTQNSLSKKGLTAKPDEDNQESVFNPESKK